MVLSITDLVVLESGKLVPLGPGDTLVVEVSFMYAVSQPVTVTLWASLGIGWGRDIESFKTLYLEAATTPKMWQDITEIPIPATGKTDGTYWMKVEVNGTEVTIQDAVVISGMPSGGIGGILGNIIPLMVVVLMMSIMMPMMEEV